MTWKLLKGDCLDLMPYIPSASVDMILTDLPYGITKNKWDIQIPLDKLWKEYNRIIKDNGPIVLMAGGLFTAELMISNKKMWRYNLVWQKRHPTNFLNAHKMPLRIHEDICIFYKKPPVYYPQKINNCPPVHTYTKKSSDGSNYNKTKIGISGGGSTSRFPTSIITFANDTQRSSLHPTQKPVKLFEYLIKTFSDQGDTILDNCAGSGTTAEAAEKTGRNSILIETNPLYCNRIFERMKNMCREKA